MAWCGAWMWACPLACSTPCPRCAASSHAHRAARRMSCSCQNKDMHQCGRKDTAVCSPVPSAGWSVHLPVRSVACHPHFLVSPGAGDWCQGGLQGAGYPGAGRCVRAAAAGHGLRQPLPGPQLWQHRRHQPLIATSTCSRRRRRRSSSSSVSSSVSVHCALTAQQRQRKSAHTGSAPTRQLPSCRCRQLGMAAGCQWAATTLAEDHQSAQGRQLQASPVADTQPLCTAAHRVQRQYPTADTLVMGQTALLCTLGAGPVCTSGGDVANGCILSHGRRLHCLTCSTSWGHWQPALCGRCCAWVCHADCVPGATGQSSTQHANTPRRTATSLSRATQSPSRMAPGSAATWRLGRGVYTTPYCLS